MSTNQMMGLLKILSIAREYKLGTIEMVTEVAILHAKNPNKDADQIKPCHGLGCDLEGCQGRCETSCDEDGTPDCDLCSRCKEHASFCSKCGQSGCCGASEMSYG